MSLKTLCPLFLLNVYLSEECWMLSVSVYEKYSTGSLYSAVLVEKARMRKILYIAIKSVPSKVLLVECD